MRITLDHRGGLPTSKTLQLMRRRTILPMQCCPRVAQIMPAKFSDSSSHQSGFPCLCVGRLQRLTKVRKNELRVFSQLVLQYFHSSFIQRHGNRLPIF